MPIDCSVELYVGIADSLLFLISLIGYWSNNKRFLQVKGAEDFNADDSLRKKLLQTENGTIKLVSVSGNVTALEPALKSLYNNDIEGVIRNTSKTEYKTQKIQGYWSDRTSILQDKTEFCKFGLTNGNKTHIVVNDVYRVDNLQSVLRQTYNNFIRPSETGFFDKLISRIHGEVSKGYQETESMLPLNSAIVVIGKATLSPDGKTSVLSPPDDFPYILTKATKEQVVQDYSFWRGFFKVTLVTSGLILAGIAFSMGKKYYKHWKAKREVEILRNQAMELRQQRGDQGPSSSENLCTVCLQNPRELIILECGHMCICVGCYENLPAPKLCPVCRGAISRVVLVFNP